MKAYKYILVNGYTSTGSSAVIDLLKEYEYVYAPDKEFRLIKDPHGIYDLDRILNNSVDLLNDDIATREFLWMAHKYGLVHSKIGPECLSYNVDFGEDFERLAIEFIQSLMDYEYKGYWWYLNLDKSGLRCFIQRVLRKTKIYDFRKHSKMRLFLKDESQFLQITKKYLNDIFISMKLPDDIQMIVLDQPIPPIYPNLGKRYFDNSYVINVERDARSVYLDLITEEKRNGDIVGHVGFDVAETHNVELFVQWFKKCRQKGLSGESLDIYFEDLVLHYDETVKMIEDYVGVDPSTHINPKMNLKPEKSAKNTRRWQVYEFQEEIKQIEKELPDYLYKYY